MTKRDSLLQHGRQRMNKELLPQEWKDDAMHSLSDNKPMDSKKPLWPDEQILDANSVDDYDNMGISPVYNYQGKEIGVKSVIRTKKHGKVR